MPIAFDTVVDGGPFFSATTGSYSHTCTGSNLLLVVGIEVFSGTSQTITGVTYNSVAMTKLTQITNTDANTMNSFWYLLGPATGSNTITVSASSSNFHVVSGSYTGVKQSGFPDASGDNSVSGTSVTSVLTSIADNCWHIGMTNLLNAGSAGANTTKRIEGAYGNISIYDNNAAITPAGSDTLTVSTSSPGIQVIMGATFEPVTAMGTGRMFAMF